MSLDMLGMFQLLLPMPLFQMLLVSPFEAAAAFQQVSEFDRATISDYTV